MTTQTNHGALDAATMAGFQDAYQAQPAHQLMQNVVTQHDVNDVALNRNIVAQATNSFSTVWTTGKSPTRRVRGAAGCSPASTCSARRPGTC